MFSRWVEMDLKSKKSLLLLGPRRAGKSTLLQSKFPRHRYVTLDDLDELDHARKDPKGWVDSLGQEFIVDEAQRLPEIAVAYKWAIDEKKAHVVLTGSTGLHLLQKTTETLAGRIEFRELPTCCFGEEFGPPGTLEDVASSHQFRLRKAAERQLEHALSYGGFPEIVSATTAMEKESLLKIYKNSYFTRDLADLSQLENLEGLRALYLALIRALGSRAEISSLSKESGLSVPTSKKYLNSLLQAGLATKLYGYHLGPAKRHISAAKTYFTDNGVIAAISDEASRGQIVENFVISELEKRRKLGFFSCEQLFYYESVAGREIDVIIEERGSVTAIEIKSSRSVTGRDLRGLREFKVDSSKKKKLRRVLFYLGSDHHTEDEIEIIPITHLFRVGRPWPPSSSRGG